MTDEAIESFSLLTTMFKLLFALSELVQLVCSQLSRNKIIPKCVKRIKSLNKTINQRLNLCNDNYVLDSPQTRKQCYFSNVKIFYILFKIWAISLHLLLPLVFVLSIMEWIFFLLLGFYNKGSQDHTLNVWHKIVGK